MNVATLVQGVIWIPAGLTVARVQFLLSARRRRAMNGTGRARGRVVEVLKYRRGRHFRPVIEFVMGDGQRVTFEDKSPVGEFDWRREFEVAYDLADPWGTAVAIREVRWFLSSVGGWVLTAVFLIVGIVCLVQGITGN